MLNRSPRRRAGPPIRQPHGAAALISCCIAAFRLTFDCAAHYLILEPVRSTGVYSPDSRAPRRSAAGRNEEPMLKNFEEFQKLGHDHVDTTMKQLGTVSKGWQAIATECAD